MTSPFALTIPANSTTDNLASLYTDALTAYDAGSRANPALIPSDPWHALLDQIDAERAMGDGENTRFVLAAVREMDEQLKDGRFIVARNAKHISNAA